MKNPQVMQTAAAQSLLLPTAKQIKNYITALNANKDK